MTIITLDIDIDDVMAQIIARLPDDLPPDVMNAVHVIINYIKERITP